jgi:hypothetical protein
VHETSGNQNQWYAAKAIDPTLDQKTPDWSGNSRGIIEDEIVPAWAGDHGMDLAPWQGRGELT